MTKIQCPKDYNWWYILAYAGIDPVNDTDRYSYDTETEELTTDTTQERLEQAFSQYDHQAWLQELLRINAPSEIERLEAVEMAMLEIVMGGI